MVALQTDSEVRYGPNSFSMTFSMEESTGKDLELDWTSFYLEVASSFFSFSEL